jgi:hypothetical protein
LDLPEVHYGMVLTAVAAFGLSAVATAVAVAGAPRPGMVVPDIAGT